MLVILVGTLAAWRLKLEPELVLVWLAAWSLMLAACRLKLVTETEEPPESHIELEA